MLVKLHDWNLVQQLLLLVFTALAYLLLLNWHFPFWVHQLQTD